MNRPSATAFLSSIPYDSHPSLNDMQKTEKHFQYTFYLLLRLIGVYCRSIRCEDTQSHVRVACIGVNFSSATRTVEGWKEVWLEPDGR